LNKRAWIEIRSDLILLFLIIFTSFFVLSYDFTGFVVDNSSSNDTNVTIDQNTTNITSTSNNTNNTILTNLTNSTVILNLTNSTILNVTNTSLSNVSNLSNISLIQIPETVIPITFTSQLVLKKDEGRHISIDNVKHTITVTDIVDDFVIITIKSDPISLGLSVGESKDVDIDKDGKVDLKVEILKINPDGSAVINLVNIPDQPIIEQKPTVEPNLENTEQESTEQPTEKIGGLSDKNKLMIFGSVLGLFVFIIIVLILIFMRGKGKNEESKLVEPTVKVENAFDTMSDQY
jgi:hypothetical protein